ncbi:hypothetical protein [uncultured Bradyrhizobium sp.]|uniref:hypothetical protein n=1 Tax=Bradyrhizobium sp. TaxID=376 RepID=UPI00261B830C|nr:hypothetical protein [uncultured Bradyrhizobium sp.]
MRTSHIAFLSAFIPALLAPALGAAMLFTTSQARADGSDRTLLATFCASANIKGSTCTRAKSYPGGGGRACDVKLTKERYVGRFLAAGNALLAVNYESECEPHATDFGGVALFEQNGTATRFIRFLPGAQGHDCIVVPKDEQQDVLVCTVGHMGQGIVESAVARMEFSKKSGKRIEIAPDFLLRAEDAVSAYGSNVVMCNEGPKYFGLANLAAGPRRNTVTVDVDYADDATIRTACGEGFPKPKELYHDLLPGEAFVPPGSEKTKRFTIDLVTGKAAPTE